MENKGLTLEEGLRGAELVSVARVNFAWPPEFVILIISEQHDGPLTFRGFPSRSAAWDAVEATALVQRPIAKPDQDVIDNTRFPLSLTHFVEDNTEQNQHDGGERA